MSRFKYSIPEEMIPECCMHKCLVRGLQCNCINFSDFLPTFIVSNAKYKRFIEGSILKIEDYSLSTFVSKETFDKFMIEKMSPDFNEKFVAYGVNYSGTNNDVGVTTCADMDGHVHYFLFDYNDEKNMNGFVYEKRVK